MGQGNVKYWRGKKRVRTPRLKKRSHLKEQDRRGHFCLKLKIVGEHVCVWPKVIVCGATFFDHQIPFLVYESLVHGYHTYIRVLVAVNYVFGYDRHMSMTGTQIRAARALLEMEQSDLAERASVSINTIRNMEAKGSKIVRVRLETLMKVQKALENAGVSFLPANGEGVGVRMKGRVKDD